ncbi:nucleotidyltransferase domain-containing protein [Halopiger xanaduensis]|uniref:DNA polymerase beta domain protein region n=1 Tax=Halopiger xanaduensis (strain DSM 18323 / JCM 14033 / SH-6) TaxID=797210 RepID=F8D636_HALXS|nr:nucleotidyltransferase domain-containing protein [Halopiger xanaduensis]AEH38896.1 DNA polymerase beta domain protein region [Halopiger xanaduensis SH-6]
MDVKVRLPLPDEQIFRYGAMDDIVEIVAQNPSSEFSNRDLQRLTGYGGPSVSNALSLLTGMELLVRRDTGTKTLYRINERRLCNADDPFLEIPQTEFREPLKRFVSRVNKELSTVAGIVCFGSVARGEADRMSDIDVFLLVADDDELIPTRRTVSDIARELEEQPIDGQRYEFEVFVESVESARRRGNDLQRIFQEGIVLADSEPLQQFKHDLFGGKLE